MKCAITLCVKKKQCIDLHFKILLKNANPWDFPGNLVVKTLPSIAGGVPVQSLSQEDPLEEGMATHSSILA